MAGVESKLAGMRKPQVFTVYPVNSGQDPDIMIVQSSSAIGIFRRSTGKGKLNWRGSNAKYFVHLSAGERYDFPRSFILMCEEARLKSGDLIGTSEITGPVYVA